VNRQLGKAPVKFYALNAGNDLMGIFLTEREAAAARKTLKRRLDWPYTSRFNGLAESMRRSPTSPTMNSAWHSAAVRKFEPRSIDISLLLIGATRPV
jgi:hypothetical protein